MPVLLLHSKVEYNCSLSASEFLFQFIKLHYGLYYYFQDDMFFAYHGTPFSGQLHIKSLLRIEIYLHFMCCEGQRSWDLIFYVV
jgi:hypothetical protein